MEFNAKNVAQKIDNTCICTANIIALIMVLGGNPNLSFNISSLCRLLAQWVSAHPLDAPVLKKIALFFICCLTKLFRSYNELVTPTHITTFSDSTLSAEIILCNTQSCTVQ